jgi:hypothetical protein
MKIDGKKFGAFAESFTISFFISTDNNNLKSIIKQCFRNMVTNTTVATSDNNTT